MNRVIFILVIFLHLFSASLHAENSDPKWDTLEIVEGDGNISVKSDDDFRAVVGFFKWNRLRNSLNEFPAVYELNRFSYPSSQIETSRIRISLSGRTHIPLFDFGFSVFIGQHTGIGLVNNHSFYYELMLYSMNRKNLLFPDENSINAAEAFFVSQRRKSPRYPSVGGTMDGIFTTHFKRINPFLRFSLPVISLFLTNGKSMNGLGMSVGIKITPAGSVGFIAESYTEIYKAKVLTNYSRIPDIPRSEYGTRFGLTINLKNSL